MAVEDRLVRVTARIMGEDYTIRGRSPEEHIHRVARFVDEKMLQISEAYPKLGTSRVAVLTAINMADELFKIREQYEQLTQLLEEEWSQRHASAADVSDRLPAARSARLPSTFPATPAPGAPTPVSGAAHSPAGSPSRPGRGPIPGQTQIAAFDNAPRGPRDRPSQTGRQLLTGDALASDLSPRPVATSRGPGVDLTEDEDQ
jgi:cell division protein ZapA